MEVEIWSVEFAVWSAECGDWWVECAWNVMFAVYGVKL